MDKQPTETDYTQWPKVNDGVPLSPLVLLETIEEVIRRLRPAIEAMEKDLERKRELCEPVWPRPQGVLDED